MPICSFSYVFTPISHSVAGITPHRLFWPSSRFSSSLILPPAINNSLESPSSAPRDFLRERKLHELKESLARGSNPSRVWSHYTGLLNVLGYERLPLEMHQAVLRRCTASTSEIRVSALRRLEAGNRPNTPHIHEGRFQVVIRNIRAINNVPALDDYHFILEQFAAVGHYIGVMDVYKELNHLGLTPRTKTFGLCLQAIAHCLTLPASKLDQSKKVSQTRRMIADLMMDMQKFGIPFTSANLDLTIRILKETSDIESFEKLMKWGYGIDLANPDRPPLEYQGVGTISSDLGLGEETVPGLPTPQPFSTAALNTTIDMLGRFGNVSKLVQAFEVLTQPLPRANQHLFTSFDDDDDFGVANSSISPNFIPPHASPNTTSYNMLLRHLSRSGHAALARHYLLEAMWLDRHTDSKLRHTLSKLPLHKVFAPHFAINRGTLLPAFGESNRDKNVGLMRWLFTKLPSILKRKKGNLKFYTQYRQRLQEKQKASLSSDKSSPASRAVSVPTPSLPSGPSSVTERTRSNSVHTSSVFDVDLDAPPTIPQAPPIKYLDLDLHLRVLERDIAEIESFTKHVELVLGRTTQRLKERLGRRVWAGKDIYLSTGDRRQKVDRDKWREIVRFQPRHGVDLFSRTPSLRSRGSRTEASRPFSTFLQRSHNRIRLPDEVLYQPRFNSIHAR